jgi:hypothetical protein
MRRRLLVVAVVVFVALPAAAQDRVVVEPDRIEHPRRTTIIMDGDTVEGARAGPTGAHVVGRTRAKFRNLIGLRTDFRRELLASGAAL